MFRQKITFLCQEMRIKKNYLKLRRRQPLYNTHQGLVISLAKFHVCTLSRLKGVKTDTQTDKIALSSIDHIVHKFVIKLVVKVLFSDDIPRLLRRA